MELAVGMAQQAREVAQTLGVAHADHLTVEGDRPVVPLAAELHRGSARCGVRLRLPGGRGQELPRVAHRRQRMAAAIDEADLRAGDQVRDGPRDQHLARRGAGEDLGGHVHRDAAELPVVQLALARVEGGPAPGPGRVALGDDRLGAADGASGAVERRTQAVAAGGERVPTEAGDLAARDLAEGIDEHHGGHDAVGLGLRPRSRHELLGLGDDRLDVSDPGKVVGAGQLEVARPGDVLGHVARMRHVDRHLVDAMEDHDGHPDRRQQAAARRRRASSAAARGPRSASPPGAAPAPTRAVPRRPRRARGPSPRGRRRHPTRARADRGRHPPSRRPSSAR